MATAGSLCTTIISDLGKSETSLSDTVLVEIQSAIRDYEAERFFFNEALLNVTLSATDTYSLSIFAAAGSGVAEVVEVDSINIQISSARSYDLKERSYDYVSSLRNNGRNGYPERYAIFNQSVIIDPEPAAGQAYVSTMAAHVKFTELAAGGFATSNVWTTQAFEMIRNGVLKRLYARRYKDSQSAAAMEVLEKGAYDALKRRTDALTDGLDGYL